MSQQFVKSLLPLRGMAVLPGVMQSMPRWSPGVDESSVLVVRTAPQAALPNVGCPLLA